MPSVLHEVLVDMFRRRSDLAPELLERCADLHYAYDRIVLGSIDLSQVTSTAYRADAVSVLCSRGDRAVGAVIVEVQLGVDRDKSWTWPLYVAALRAEQQCPVTLLVLTSEPAVARWARTPISLGHPGFHLAPVVIGFNDVPRIVDRDVALGLPQLAVLSAMAHPELEVAAVAMEAIMTLPEDQKRLYWDIIMSRQPEAIRQALEVRMQGYEYQSEFARKYYGQGREEGREEGLRAAVVALARTKLDSMTVDDVALIAALHDAQALTALVSALGLARNSLEARAALDVAVAGKPGVTSP